jgi:hypothetical protein
MISAIKTRRAVVHGLDPWLLTTETRVRSPTTSSQTYGDVALKHVYLLALPRFPSNHHSTIVPHSPIIAVHCHTHSTWLVSKERLCNSLRNCQRILPLVGPALVSVTVRHCLHLVCLGKPKTAQILLPNNKAYYATVEASKPSQTAGLLQAACTTGKICSIKQNIPFSLND